MAALPAVKEQRGVGKAHPYQHVSYWFRCFVTYKTNELRFFFLARIRFAPPLVISEEDLAHAVKVIGECLIDLDKLDDIPGDEGSEKGHTDVLAI